MTAGFQKGVFNFADPMIDEFFPGGGNQKFRLDCGVCGMKIKKKKKKKRKRGVHCHTSQLRAGSSAQRCRSEHR